MSELQIDQPTEIKAPAKRKPQKRRKAAAKPAKTEAAGEFAGITAKDCPAACRADRCCISTVGVCAHPYKSAVNGFGPVTMENRERARKLIKHQMVELKG